MFDINTYKPNDGAEEAYNRIAHEGKLDELAKAIDDTFNGGNPLDADVDDLLWFSRGYIYDLLDMDFADDEKVPNEPID